jgi:predicted PurR-regulated permease PerM
VIRAATIYLVLLLGFGWLLGWLAMLLTVIAFIVGVAVGLALEDEWREQEMERFDQDDRGCVG